MNKLLYLREDATSALAGFHASPRSRLNWNLEMLVFQDGGKPENLEKKPSKQGREPTKQQTQPTYDVGSGNLIRVTLVGGDCSHHCAVLGPQKSIPSFYLLIKKSPFRSLVINVLFKDIKTKR